MDSALRTGFAASAWPDHHFGLSEERWSLLRGKAVWLTGAGTGYGRAIACILGAAGCRVFLTGRRRAKLEQTIEAARALGASKERFVLVPADLADPAEINRAAARIREEATELFALIANAALPSSGRLPLLEGDLSRWDDMMAVNLRAPWLLTRAVAGSLAAAGSARVLFISSEAGWADTAGFGAYNVSKAGLNSLCHSFAREFATAHPGADIQVNGILPGEAETEMNPESKASPFRIVATLLELLTQDWGGPSGRFFHADGRSLAFGHSQAWQPALDARPAHVAQTLLHQMTEAGKQFFLPRSICFDHGPRDLRILSLVANRLVEKKRSLAFYGAGKLCRYMLERVPRLCEHIRCIVDDHPSSQGQAVCGIPVLPASELPGEIETVFFCTTDLSTMVRMLFRAATRKWKIERVSLDVIQELDPRLIPEEGWQKPIASIYPKQIPEIVFEKGQDMILLELPPRYQPLVPNGIGYVNNILRTTGIRFQTMDLNIILYHRFHQRRILNRLDSTAGPEGQRIPEDPWAIVECRGWEQPEVLKYFARDIEEIVSGLIKAKPRILGISLSGFNRELAKTIVRRVKEQLPELIVIVGGYDCIRPLPGKRHFADFDYMVIGEAEETLGPLIAALMRGERPMDQPGILSRHDSAQRVFEYGPKPTDLDKYGYPQYEWADLKLYQAHGGQYLIPVAASRGCEWSRCRFCSECFTFRARDPQKVVDEIEFMTGQGFRAIHFNDSDMNGDPAILQQICEGVIARGIKTALVGQLRIDRRNTPEFLDKLKRAGCAHLRYGVDGWNDRVLRLQAKGYSMKVVEQVLRDSHAAGFYIGVNVVLGLPGETEQDVDEMIENLIRLSPYYDMVENIHTLILGVGNQYYANPEKYKIRFRSDQRELYLSHVDSIPTDQWYSEDPYIDQQVRVERLERVAKALSGAAIELGGYAKHTVERLARQAQDVTLASQGRKGEARLTLPPAMPKPVANTAL